MATKRSLCVVSLLLIIVVDMPESQTRMRGGMSGGMGGDIEANMMGIRQKRYVGAVMKSRKISDAGDGQP